MGEALPVLVLCRRWHYATKQLCPGELTDDDDDDETDDYDEDEYEDEDVDDEIDDDDEVAHVSWGDQNQKKSKNSVKWEMPEMAWHFWECWFRN